jgi:Domain of unknown function (DUF4326)
MIKIGNKTTGATGEYVGRGSALGNPFSHLAHSKAEVHVTSRAEAVIAQNEYMLELIGRTRASHWAARQLLDSLKPQDREKRTVAIKNQLNLLIHIAHSQDLTLVCYCTDQRCDDEVPKTCHAENIARLLEQALKHRGAA